MKTQIHIRTAVLRGVAGSLLVRQFSCRQCSSGITEGRNPHTPHILYMPHKKTENRKHEIESRKQKTVQGLPGNVRGAIRIFFRPNRLDSLTS